MSQGSKFERIPTHKECKCREYSSQTRLGGEICSSDVIMHKGHYAHTTLRNKGLLCLLFCLKPNAQRFNYSVITYGVNNTNT